MNDKFKGLMSINSHKILITVIWQNGIFQGQKKKIKTM